MLRSIVGLAVLAHSTSAFVAPSPGFAGSASSTKAVLSLRGGAVPRVGGMDLQMSTAAPATTKPKLMYFDARGVVEPIRLLLAAVEADYEDFRYTVDMTLKPPAAPEFQKAKESGELAANMGRAPILEVDGAQIGQSHAIARFLARKHNLVGDSDIEAGQIDAIYEHVRDIKDQWVKVRLANNKETDDAVKKANIDKFLSEDLPQWTGRLEGALKVNGTREGHAVGSRLSLADVVIYAWLSCGFPEEHAAAVTAAYAECAAVKAIVERVGSNAGIKKWEAERPKTFM